MDFITRYAAFLMFALFVILACAVSMKALPLLVGPVLVAALLATLAGIVWRWLK